MASPSWKWLLGAACGVMLAGCPAAKEPSPDAPPGQEESASTANASPSAEKAAPVEPSVRYLPADAPAGEARAVIVEGYPLVHTRQLLPLDGQGKLVGEGAVEQQIEQVLANLETVLGVAGSGMEKLVRLNIYADAPATADKVREVLAARPGAAVHPAITVVVTPLPEPKALVAVDAVAVAAEEGKDVTLLRCDSVAGSSECADAAVLPPGGVVYLSGHPDKSPLPEAAGKSLAALLEIGDQLKLAPSQVVAVKAFVQSAADAEVVRTELKKAFPGQIAPPVTFVEWIATAPVEIEMVVSLPLGESRPAEPVRYYTPPKAKASPTFSLVALVQTPRQIYISGLSARAAGNGEAQVRDVFEQLKAILAESGSDLLHLAKGTYYVSDDDSSEMLNKLRPEYFDPKRPPAASKVTVHGVGQAERGLTLDMIAVGAK